MALPAPALPMIKQLAEVGARRQDEIIGWFSTEPEQAAAAFALGIEQGAIVRVSGKSDADATARWGVRHDALLYAMGEASADSN